jgi:hypothetical protein
LHPDFEKASNAARWEGKLAELFTTLRRLALSAPEVEGKQAWVTRVLPRGAFVGMRMAPGQYPRRELRIARRDGPTDELAHKRWEQELGVFLNHDDPPGGGIWQEMGPDVRTPTGGVIRMYIELFKGEVRPGVMVCHYCKQECEWDIATDPQSCLACRKDAGNRRRVITEQPKKDFDDPESALAEIFSESSNR